MTKINAVEPPSWLLEKSPDRDVILSSRIRFARNLQQYPFPRRATRSDQSELRSAVFESLDTLDFTSSMARVRVDDQDSIEQRLLVERRLASQELIDDSCSGLFYNEEESLSVMINEEDHLRIQAFAAGNRLDEPFQNAYGLERRLDEQLTYAYHDQWGFLTSCPTNVGTGLRASILLHLPGLVMTQKIERMLRAVSNLGLTVRGYTGEGSESRGFYFQLSNQVTLGQSAEAIRDNLKRVAKQVADQERSARQALLKSSKVEVEDQIWRSLGILRYAQKIQSSEALEALSYCRLGIDYGMINQCTYQTVDGLLLLIQPAHLIQSVGDQLQSEERDFYRARRLRREVSETDPTRVNEKDSREPPESNSCSSENGPS